MEAFYESLPAKRERVRSLEEQLRELDKQRDALRAALSDATLETPSIPHFYERTPEKEAEWLAALEARIKRRAERRAWEREWCGVIPPGVWDEDLDKHLGEATRWELGDGVTGEVRRNMEGGWNGYLFTPEGETHSIMNDGEAGVPCPKQHYRVYRTADGFSGEPRSSRIYLPSLELVGFQTKEKVMADIEKLKARLCVPAAPPAPSAEPAPVPKRSWAQVAAGGK
jgi:hypothetical protein